MEKVAYSPFVFISLVVHGLAAIAIALAPNTSPSFGYETVSELLPVRVRFFTSPPLLDQKVIKVPPANPSLHKPGNSQLPIAEFYLQTREISHLSKSNQALPGHRSISRVEEQNGDSQVSRPILVTPHAFKTVTVVSPLNQKRLSKIRTTPSPASRPKTVLNSVHPNQTTVRQSPSPSIEQFSSTSLQKPMVSKPKAVILPKHSSRKKLKSNKGNSNQGNKTIKAKSTSFGENSGKHFLSSKSNNKLILSKVDNYIRIPSKKSRHLKNPKTATELLSSLKDPIMNQDSVTKAKKQKGKRKARLAPLMTQDIRYRGYRYAIWKKIDELLFYPSAAANAKVSGRVVVRFEVTRDGQLATLKLLNGSGFELLDEEALMAVRNAAPFPKFPSTINGIRIAIKSEIFYEP